MAMGRMTRASEGVKTKEKGRPSATTVSIRRLGTLTLVGGLALAGLVAWSGWMAYSSILSTGIDHSATAEAPAAASQVSIASPGTGTASNEQGVVQRGNSFEERFAAAATPPVPRPPLVVALIGTPALDVRRTETPEPSAAAQIPLPRPAPRAVRVVETPSSAPKIPNASSVARAEEPTIFERLFGGIKTSALQAYASVDPGAMGLEEKIPLTGPQPFIDDMTAVYDISAKTVYLPNGTKLEAHSGFGDKMDDPKYVHVPMRGATPPHVYDLSLRENLFHGVQAIRLSPVGGKEAIHGRTGLLAHSYLLGPNGDSNGCVSVKDYDAFLKAYQAGEIKRLAVVE